MTPGWGYVKKQAHSGFSRTHIVHHKLDLTASFYLQRNQKTVFDLFKYQTGLNDTLGEYRGRMSDEIQWLYWNDSYYHNSPRITPFGDRNTLCAQATKFPQVMLISTVSETQEPSREQSITCFQLETNTVKEKNLFVNLNIKFATRYCMQLMTVISGWRSFLC